MRVCLESLHLKSHHTSTVSPTKLSHTDWNFRGKDQKSTCNLTGEKKKRSMQTNGTLA